MVTITGKGDHPIYNLVADRTLSKGVNPYLLKDFCTNIWYVDFLVFLRWIGYNLPVGGFNPFEKICSSNWIISPGKGEHKKSLKPPPTYFCGWKFLCGWIFFVVFLDVFESLFWNMLFLFNVLMLTDSRWNCFIQLFWWNKTAKK